MRLDDEKMKRQVKYEAAFHWLGVLLKEELVTQKEYDCAVAEIESEYQPIIVHIPLLYKE